MNGRLEYRPRPTWNPRLWEICSGPCSALRHIGTWLLANTPMNLDGFPFTQVDLEDTAEFGKWVEKHHPGKSIGTYLNEGQPIKGLLVMERVLSFSGFEQTQALETLRKLITHHPLIVSAVKDGASHHKQAVEWMIRDLAMGSRFPVEEVKSILHSQLTRDDQIDIALDNMKILLPHLEGKGLDARDLYQRALKSKAPSARLEWLKDFVLKEQTPKF